MTLSLSLFDLQKLTLQFIFYYVHIVEALNKLYCLLWIISVLKIAVNTIIYLYWTIPRGCFALCCCRIKPLLSQTLLMHYLSIQRESLTMLLQESTHPLINNRP